MQRLLIRQPTQVMEEAAYLLLNRRVLLIGADHVLALPPQRIQRVQRRRALRQPQQGHPRDGWQRRLGGVAGILVQQQGYMPASVSRPDLRPEGTEVKALPLLPRHQQTCPR